MSDSEPLDSGAMLEAITSAVFEYFAEPHYWGFVFDRDQAERIAEGALAYYASRHSRSLSSESGTTAQKEAIRVVERELLTTDYKGQAAKRAVLNAACREIYGWSPWELSSASPPTVSETNPTPLENYNDGVSAKDQTPSNPHKASQDATMDALERGPIDYRIGG